MKKILIITLLLLSTLVVLAAVASYQDIVKSDVSTYSGTFKMDKDRTYLLEGKTQRQLLLAPQPALDSLGIKLSPQDSLVVTGVLSQAAILVTSIKHKGKQYTLRGGEQCTNNYDELSSVEVNPAKCIGCKLCVSNCPVGAITMVNGKAFIDSAKCVSCGICMDGNGKFRGCPVRAIGK